MGRVLVACKIKIWGYFIPLQKMKQEYRNLLLLRNSFQNRICDIKGWMTGCRLQLNEDKTETILFNS